MAVKTEGNKIWLTRGDSLQTVVDLLQGETPYIPQAGDTIRFALKHARMEKDRAGYLEFADEEPLVVKAIPNDTLTLALDPEDTKDLGFGLYKYDVEITFADGYVDTFIADEDFTLTPEVD